MHTCSSASPPVEVRRLPSSFFIGGYRVFFWCNENGEPIHVRVCKGTPTKNSTKIWLTRQGGCIVASNGAAIPSKALNDLCAIIAAQHDQICDKWKEFYRTDSIAYYC